MDRGAHAVAKLQVSGEEIGMQVRQEHVGDSQVVRLGEGQVLVDVALRIDDRGGVRLLVADEIGRVRQAIQVELLQDHRAPSFGSIIAQLSGGR